jgi:hypothetical protein
MEIKEITGTTVSPKPTTRDFECDPSTCDLACAEVDGDLLRHGGAVISAADLQLHSARRPVDVQRAKVRRALKGALAQRPAVAQARSDRHPTKLSDRLCTARLPQQPREGVEDGVCLPAVWGWRMVPHSAPAALREKGRALLRACCVRTTPTEGQTDGRGNGPPHLQTCGRMHRVPAHRRMSM